MLRSYDRVLIECDRDRDRNLLDNGWTGYLDCGVLNVIVIGDLFTHIFLHGINPRYKSLFLPGIGGGLVVSPLYSPNRGTKQLKVGEHLTLQSLG